jgi:imidazolonepropionase-like amidohydrolase
MVGTIETGKIADIIVVEGDPLEDINILHEENRIKMVMKEGVVVITR